MISGGISSQGAKAGFTTSLFEIEYRQHGIKARLKLKRVPLRADKAC
jgi:hypothetical protein